jgi:hypothetical protein
MRLLIAPLLALALSAALPAIASAAPKTVTARTVQISQPDHFGGGHDWLYGFSPLIGELQFRDDGTNLTVLGKATGFDPNLQFVTLLYATPSVRVGALACIPPTPNPYTPPQMFTAYWLPVGSRTRTLTVVKNGAAYVSLASIATASIRYDSTPQVGNPAATTQTPARYWLQVCANV